MTRFQMDPAAIDWPHTPEEAFVKEVELAFRKHFGDSPRGAAAIVLYAQLDSGNPENFADITEEMLADDEWRLEPTQMHGGFTVVIPDPGE